MVGVDAIDNENERWNTMTGAIDHLGIGDGELGWECLTFGR